MKRLYLPRNIGILLIALIFICVYGFPNITQLQAKDETSTLIAALRKNGIIISEQTDYSKLVEKLQSIQINVSGPFKENVLNYLYAGRGSDLIKIQTSKPEILAWHFHDVIFLKKDLLFAQYDDGEMLGGDILLKIISSGDEVSNMISLWNYH